MNILIDYKDLDGNDYYQAFYMLPIFTLEGFMRMISTQLYSDGYIPTAFTIPIKEMSMEELNDYAKGKSEYSAKDFYIIVTNHFIDEMEAKREAEKGMYV